MTALHIVSSVLLWIGVAGVAGFLLLLGIVGWQARYPKTHDEEMHFPWK